MDIRKKLEKALNVKCKDSAYNEDTQKEINYLKEQVVKEEEFIENVFHQIGYQYFDLNKDNPDAIFRELCMAIKGAEDNIKKSKEDLAQLQKEEQFKKKT